MENTRVFESPNVYKDMTDEELKVYREFHEKRTEMFMKEYGLRFRSASGIVGEMDFIQSFGYKPEDLDRFVDMLLKIGYDRGANKDRR